jgi:hypothetical protein
MNSAGLVSEPVVFRARCQVRQFAINELIAFLLVAVSSDVNAPIGCLTGQQAPAVNISFADRDNPFIYTRSHSH